MMSASAFSQQKDSVKVDVKAKKDTVNTAKPKDKKPEKIQPFEKVITNKAVSDEGIITVHKVEDKYYFEIPDKALKKEFLVVTRLTKAGAEMRMGTVGYAGDQISQNVISFEKGPNDKVFLRSISYVDYAKDSTSAMYKTVMRNNVNSIEQAFDIKAFGKEKNSTVIDVTDFINADNDVVSFDTRFKKGFRVGAFQKDKSFVNFVKSFPTNIEINTTKTYNRSAGEASPIPGAPKPEVSGNYTVEVNSSIILLPENKMQARYFDPRVGYFTVGYTDFDENPQGVERVSLVKRWRLEPKAKDLEKYKRGELVEPEKPIVFYIDPLTPKKWIPYLIQGVNDWQKAFEKAGFKNAIYAKVPNAKEDPEWSLEDARFSAIVYKPSDVPNASGPSIADPRTGEILESHINWYHNVMKLLNDWYFVQASPNDPRARKVDFDDELMGQLIRFVSSHEVGHTLGLRHNFGSSSTVPVENLRNKSWLKANGHTPSIMDYARFNYVAQPEDNVGEAGLMPRIGDYDDWAIEWGYRRFYNYNSPEKEKAHLNKWVMEKLQNPRLWFGSETNPYDPRSQSEQVGDNPMLAGKYGVKNLQRIMENIEAWSTKPNEDYSSLNNRFTQVSGQFARYLGHVSKYIGGVKETPKMVEQKGAIYELVSKSEQKEALKFLSENVFTTPNWLLKTSVLTKIDKSPVEVVENLQKTVLNRVLSEGVLNKLYEGESLDANAYAVYNYLQDIKNSVFSELKSSSKIDIYRRNLQKNFVETLIARTQASKPSTGRNAETISDNSDVKSLTRGVLREIKADASKNAQNAQDAVTKYHLEDLVYRIDKALEVK
ncbi:zinc-dependent metalloprotease [Cloacibacterium caeni]|uniref:zinc-dependent metalloprotease n=1 Tax=Cloacibacterium caeni TaxID=2004710 RepID=UPI001BCD6B77|nr:zinc-dependent metalloprotease [Cloacibacterium caeni]